MSSNKSNNKKSIPFVFIELTALWRTYPARYILVILGLVTAITLSLCLGAVALRFEALKKNLENSLLSRLYVCERAGFWSGGGVLPEEKLRQVTLTKGVKTVVPILVNKLNPRRLFFLGIPEVVIGIKPEQLQFFTGDIRAEEGKVALMEDPPGAVLGAEVAGRMKTGAGGTILLSGKKIKVNGVMEETHSIFDRQIIIPLGLSARIYGRQGLYTALMVIPKEDDTGRDVVQKLKKISGITILSPGEIKQELASTLGLWSSLTSTLSWMSFWGMIVLLLAGLLLSLRLRFREIGIKRVLGARLKDIFLSFFLDGMALTAAGTIPGIFLAWWLTGWLEGRLLNSESGLFMFTPALVFKTAVFAIIIGAVISSAVALYASYLSPGKTLKSE
ncbi:MAG: FtsX-like permease family protein [Chloroflexi bacterium]|nr:FtsX-like permease family protein [Chloroflexota bacterium]